MYNISIITAFDKNRVIGYKNSLPWSIPEDLQYFKSITMGYTIVMGRKTFESIGKALPERKNCVLSKNYHNFPKGIISFKDYRDVLEMSKKERVFIIGGAEIYKLFLPYSSELYITHIEDSFKGDVYFPKVDNKEWKMEWTKEKKDKKFLNFNYYFCFYKRCNQLHLFD